MAVPIKKMLTAKTSRVPPIPEKNWLSLGSTNLNLAVSGRADVGISKGMYVWYVGDSSTGKTWFSLALAAEATMNPNFSNYSYYFDNAENGAYMDVARYFGTRLASKLQPPPAIKKLPAGNSSTIEEFYYHLKAAMERGPCIYILDSMDALEGDEDLEKFEEILGAVGTAKEGKVSGSYGTAVAKANSKNIKRVVSALERNGSILIIINQVRDVIGGMQFGPKKKPGQGGKALRFFAHVQLWTTHLGNMKRTVMKKERKYGDKVGIRVMKNRVSGWEGDIEIPFLRKYGIDDIGACVDYLVDEQIWKKTDGKIHAPDFNFTGDRETLIKGIEMKDGRDAKLRSIVERVWKEIDDKTVLKRKPRYV